MFILGCDDLNRLDSFLNAPFKAIDDEIMSQYDVNSWIKRFS